MSGRNERLKNSLHISEIIKDRLFLGDKVAAHSTKILRSRSIEVIVNCAKGIENKWLIEFEYKNFRINDTLKEDLLKHLESFCQFVDEKKEKRVFVHCLVGVSRSASFVIGYVMWKNRWSYEKSLEYVRQNRPSVQPNDNFEKQLLRWEQTVQDTRNNDD